MLKSSLSACDPQEAFGCRSFASGLIVFGSMPSSTGNRGNLGGLSFDRRSKFDRLGGNDYVSTHPLNPLNPRRARFERITEVLGFAGHLPVPELHNAHRVRRLLVVG